VSIYRFIAAEKAEHKVSLICALLDVSRSGFYAWQRREPCRRALEDQQLLQRIRLIHEQARGVYGVRRVHAELRLAHDIRVGRKRVERLMRGAGLSGMLRRPRAGTTIRVPGVRVASDLVARDFNPTAPDRLWVADITYLATWEGWLYMAAVQDAYSRQIVGWSMGQHMRAELVVDALQMALARRRPAPGLIHHSDQGSQYVSLAFGHTARKAQIALSMGATGDAYDNALAETFFATLKKELVHRRSWPTRQELRAAVFDYVETFYNHSRRHSTLGYLSPRQYEQSRLQINDRQLQTAT
jgi:putative transposase